MISRYGGQEVVRVLFPAAGRDVTVPAETTVLEAMRLSGASFYVPCGGRGECGKCKVVVLGGACPPTDAEKRHLEASELRACVRLACQARLTGDATVDAVGPSGPGVILVDGLARVPRQDPMLSVRGAEVDTGSPRGAQSDWERFAAALGLEAANEPDLSLARRLAGLLTGGGASDLDGARTLYAVVFDDAAIDVLGEEQDIFGVALDVGTSTLVAYLVNLRSGRVEAAAGTANPQAIHGADVISRISYACTAGGLETLRQEVVSSANRLIDELADAARIRPKQIYALSAVGNTCMNHLFLGIPPDRLARSPYLPVVRRCSILSPGEVGINMNENGRAWFLPNVAGFVGSDTVGVALACGIDRRSCATLAVDIGTNGEILLADKRRMLACSTAAGPAFEGVNISAGMIATEGAIDHAWIAERGDGPDIEVSVIGGGQPKGICGSGLVSLTAALRQAGVLDASGSFVSRDRIPRGPLRQRVIDGPSGPEFALAPCGPERGARRPAMTLTQRDVRELQLAKGAIRAGVEVLLGELGLKADDLDMVILAGAFGTYVDREAAMRIGLLPPLEHARVVSAGNAAGMGAVLALTSRSAYRDALRLADEIEHVDLASRGEFQAIFADSMLLGDTLA